MGKLQHVSNLKTRQLFLPLVKYETNGNILNSLPQSQLVPGGWTPMGNNQTRYLKIEAENPLMVNEEMPFHSRILAMKQDDVFLKNIKR